MIKLQLTSGESLKILTSTSHQVVCLLGQGVLTFLQPHHSASFVILLEGARGYTFAIQNI